MTTPISFQKLFAEADDACGIGRLFIPSQQSTETIEQLIREKSQDEKNVKGNNAIDSKKILFSYQGEHPNVKKLRSLILHVPGETHALSIHSNDDQVFRKLKRNEILNNKSIELLNIPEVSMSWDAEVRAMMMTETDSGSIEIEEENDEKVNDDKVLNLIKKDTQMEKSFEAMNLRPYIVPRTKLPETLAPYFCYDRNVIDVDNERDELDVIIPNIEGNISDDDGEESGGLPPLLDQIVKPVNIEAKAEIVPSLVQSTESAGASSNVQQDGPTASIAADGKEETLTKPTETKPAYTSITGNKNLTALEKRRLLAEEKRKRLANVALAQEAAKTLEKLHGPKSVHKDEQLYGKRRGKSIIASLTHANIALSHRNTKPDLREIELKYFHHPILSPAVLSEAVWNVTVESEILKKKAKSNTKSTPKDFQTALEERQNMSLIDGNIIIMEYIEENPPVIANLGMASAILHYHKESKTDNDNNQDDDDNNNNDDMNKNDHDLTSKSERKQSNWQLLATYRLPKHVQLLLKLKDNKSYQKTIEKQLLLNNNHDIGEYITLTNDDESPFLGELNAGDSQYGLINNLFKAPIFRQKKTISYDYLLIPASSNHSKTNENNGNSNKKEIRYILRSIPHGNSFTVGQLEPQRIIYQPTTEITAIQSKFYLLSAIRYLSMDITMNGIEKNQLQEKILKYCSKESRSPHKSHHREKLNTIISEIANEIKDGNKLKWILKESHEMNEKEYTEEEISKSFTPEDVCIQESTNAMEYRLRELGIIKNIELYKLEDYIHRLLQYIQCKEKQYIQIKQQKDQQIKQLSASKAPQLINNLNRLLKNLWNEIKSYRMELQTTEYIFQQLCRAPWNTSEAYYSVIITKDYKHGFLDINSMDCDPSGCGEGYSYKRIIKPAIINKSKKNERLQGTENDLRKRTKRELQSMLLKLGVKANEIEELERWDMVHLARDLMNQTAVIGNAPSALSKFVRLDGVYGSILNEQSFKTNCNEIWNRQYKALTYTDTKLDEMILKDSLLDEDDDMDMNNNQSNDEDLDSIIEKSIRRREDEMIVLRSEPSTSTKTSMIEESSYDSNQFKPKPKVTFVHDTMSKKSSADNSLSIEPSSNPLDPSMLNPKSSINTSEIKSNKQFTKPNKIVKRVTKTFIEDNDTIKEVIKVEFIVSEIEIRRVENQTNELKRQREYRRLFPYGKSFKQSNQYSSQYLVSHEDDYMDLLDDSQYLTSSGTLGLKISLKRKVSDDLFHDGYYEGDDAYLRQQYRSKKRNNQSYRNCRLPRVELAAKFEEKIIDLWNSKRYAMFRYPVPQEVAGYYDMIEQPISLYDIREKIYEYKYPNAQKLLNDVILMADNCERFNGKASELTKCAMKLVEQFKISLNHDRKHFGVEGDSIRILEEAIQKKEYYTRKTGGHNQRALLSGNHSTSSGISKLSSEQLSMMQKHVEPKTVSIQATSSNSNTTAVQPSMDRQSTNLPKPTIPQASRVETASETIPQQLKNDLSSSAIASIVQKPSKEQPIRSNVMSMLDDDDDSSGDEEVIEAG